ncbi:Leucine-rich_repeat protein [Hexamita inflata]|uniref:Leucine-rich repeat protein n=1 Tax=Hexamita inflata TaxID=28002 RepID=A0AA86UEI6_9EUKA|nr:Leucine-rich repeat protein [Hexamita inflata]
MTEQNQNAQNEEYDEFITRVYEGKIKNGRLEISNQDREYPQITSLRFLQKLDIQALYFYNDTDISIKLQSQTIKELTFDKTFEQDKLNLNIDDLELENLEVLDLHDNNLENVQLYNLAKFKKLNTLNVSRNRVDLTHIHCLISLTKLSMQKCGLKNIDQISLLLNLKDLNLSQNILENQQLNNNLFKLKKLQALDISDNKVDLTYIHSVKSLTHLNIQECGLQNIDQISSLVNLEELDLSYNECIKDFNPLSKIQSLSTLQSIHKRLRLKKYQLNRLANQFKISEFAFKLAENYRFNRLIGKSQRARYQFQLGIGHNSIEVFKRSCQFIHALL